MDTKEFDTLVKARFEQHEPEYNPDMWQQLSRRLDTIEHKKKVVPLWPAMAGVAAAIVLLVAVPLFWYQQKADNVAREIINLDTATPLVAQNNLSPVQKDKSLDTAAVQQSHLSVHKQQFVSYHDKQDRTKALYPAAKGEETPLQADNVKETVDVASNIDLVNPKPKNRTISQRPDILTMDEYVPQTLNKDKKTSINLLGGFNYNDAQTGFTIGASANRRLGKRLYIEGNVALVTSNNSSFAKGNSFADGYAGGAASPADAPHINAASQPVAYSTSYLQISPVIGYNIFHRFSVGAGPDIQQLLSKRAFYGSASEVPFLDFGVVGKAEYGISKKLKAGVQYRSGINELIYTNEAIAERNYFQVQLKFSILSK